MKDVNKSLVDRLKDGYEEAKKPLAYFLVLTSVLLETLPSQFIPEQSRTYVYATLLIALALILLEVLFKIYEKSVKNESKFGLIDSNDLHSKILDIVNDEEKVSIKYVGIAGRNGWNTVLQRLLNENDPSSLISNRTDFNIEIALFNPEKVSGSKSEFERFDSVTNITKTIDRVSDYVAENISGSKIDIYHYDHMPNMLGFLIDDNYLFTTHAYWEKMYGKMILRGAGTKHLVYDKNDEFGGQEVIKRFYGWFEYIKKSKTDNLKVEIKDE